MFDLQTIKKRFENCPCGKKHELNIKDVCIGSGIVAQTGEILKRNGFQNRLLLVADCNTLAAAEGILSSLEKEGFLIVRKIYENLREASVEEVAVLVGLLAETDGVISVGTGSLNDICRRAACEANKPLAIFATAASMDGFASYGAPLIDGYFKVTYDAKSPEVIIGDTKILAAAPTELKSAGFGDMVGKYVGLIDWQVANLLIGEYYCPNVAALTREATDKIMSLADRITANDEESAEAVFSALLLTGIGMSYTKNSRPASGTEHMLSHYWECQKLLEGKISDFHGKKVGVATLAIMEIYDRLEKFERVKAHKERLDRERIYAAYGPLKNDVIKLNEPDTITDEVNPKDIEEKWGEIRAIIRSVPTKEEMCVAMKKAGCATTNEEIAVSDELYEEGLAFHPYLRRRLSLLRIANMIEEY